MTDAQLIATWQQFRRAMRRVDAALAASLIATDSPNSLVHEALAALAVAPSRMLPTFQLASVLGLSTAGSSKLVDRLVHVDFAYRHQSSLDRTVVLVALTDRGAHVEQRSTPHYATGLRSEFAVLGAERVAMLREVCAVLEHRLPDADDPHTRADADEPYTAEPSPSYLTSYLTSPTATPADGRTQHPRIDDGG